MNIVKCERCEQTMIMELFKTHICSPPYRGSKEIEVDFIGKFMDERGREIIQAFGMDGITYRLVKTYKEKIPMPFTPTNPNNHENQPESEQYYNCGCVPSEGVHLWLLGGGW